MKVVIQGNILEIKRLKTTYWKSILHILEYWHGRTIPRHSPGCKVTWL